jgi:hypothetical protein
MRTSDRSQLTEEKLHQSTLSRLENLVKESRLYPVAQAPPGLSPKCTEMEKVKVRKKPQHQ